MVDVRPFRGLRYNIDQAGPLATLLCPPYDAISRRDWAALHLQSRYNSVHLELALQNRKSPQQTDAYATAAARLAAWQERGILQQDALPSLYLYEHRFPSPTAPQQVCVTRRGILAAVRLHAWHERVVLPHEQTMPGPVNERLRLLRATHVNLSPLFALYADDTGAVAAALDDAWASAPEAIATSHGEEHVLRVVRDPATHGAVAAAFADRQLYIADGHHRYEGALAYRDEQRAAFGRPAQDHAGYEFVFMLLVDLAEQGLDILPTHRLVRGLRASLVETIPLPALPAAWVTALATGDTSPATTAAAAQAALAAVPESQRAFVLVTAAGAWRVMPPDDAPWPPAMAGNYPESWRSLDVAVAEGIVLGGICGLTPTTTLADHVTYTRDATAAVQAVHQGMADLAVLLRPVAARQVVTLAQAGDRMPPKSSYFYPKPATGLVFRPVTGCHPPP